MKSTIFLHNNLNREYQVIGSGKRILYAFHGFGRSTSEWEAFSPWLEKEFTIYSFADFFHEKSEFPNSRMASDPLRKDEISTFFNAFAKEQKHSLINLIAYSSGGRTALSLIELQAFTIDEVWLFAPDGVEISFWNNLFCKNKWVQLLFKRIIRKPDMLFNLARGLNKVGLLSSSLTYFVLANMRDEKKRQMIFNFWMVYREVVPDMIAVSKAINETEIKLHLIFGIDDVVIPISIGRRFVKQLGDNADLTELGGGHLLIDKKHLNKLKSQFPLK